MSGSKSTPSTGLDTKQSVDPKLRGMLSGVGLEHRPEDISSSDMKAFQTQVHTERNLLFGVGVLKSSDCLIARIANIPGNAVGSHVCCCS